MFCMHTLNFLLKDSANLICQSLIHNEMSKAISIPVLYNKTQDILNIINDADYKDPYVYNATLIPKGTIVQIKGTRCDGIIDCHKGIDEQNCGVNKFLNYAIGNC